MASNMRFSYAKQEQRYKKDKEKSAIIRIVVSLLVILTFAIVIVDVSKQSREIHRLDLENRELSEELKLAEKEQQEIQDLEKKMGTDEFVEKMARDELGMITPDEFIFVED